MLFFRHPPSYSDGTPSRRMVLGLWPSKNTKERDNYGRAKSGDGMREKYGVLVRASTPKRYKGASITIPLSAASVANQKATAQSGSEDTKNVPFRQY